MKTIIKINLLVILFTSGIEAYSQETDSQSWSSVEVERVNVDTALTATTRMERSAESYNQQPSVTTLDISSLKLKDAHFQNKEIHEPSRNYRWEDSLLQSDNFPTDNYLIEGHI